ncbi:MAG: zinc ribbon domain-containing protein [Planctomycetes bacterium]|nr:zinc ribbon domain-containing protein [Planctomycetota bacterium]MBM4079224.1 zinc ribbon domain-containing protein [Planctomycetota bacterium]MBM4085628.1 zinc ribbon domain-containing protein [Planctomycetota bacterium]
MPIYEYECGKCDHQFEKLVRPSEKVKCPECGSGQLRKRFSVISARSGARGVDTCKESTPSCSPTRCRSGVCGMAGRM